MCKGEKLAKNRFWRRDKLVSCGGGQEEPQQTKQCFLLHCIWWQFAKKLVKKSTSETVLVSRGNLSTCLHEYINVLNRVAFTSAVHLDLCRIYSKSAS